MNDDVEEKKELITLSIQKLNELFDQDRTPVVDKQLIDEVDKRMKIKYNHAFYFHGARTPIQCIKQLYLDGKTITVEFKPGMSVFTDDRQIHLVTYKSEKEAEQVFCDFQEWSTK